MLALKLGNDYILEKYCRSNTRDKTVSKQLAAFLIYYASKESHSQKLPPRTQQKFLFNPALQMVSARRKPAVGTPAFFYGHRPT